MSAMAQIEQRVREIIEGLLDALRRHEKKQDDRLDAIEARLDAIEAGGRSVSARAGAARASGSAKNTGS